MSAALLAAACGGGDDAEADANRAATVTTRTTDDVDNGGRPLDPCELISQEAFQAFVDRHTTEAVTITPVKFGCGYDPLFELAGGNSVQFSTSADADLDTRRARRAEFGLADVDGLGDDAFYSGGSDATLYVLDDSVVYTFTTGFGLGAALGFADDKSGLVALAEEVLRTG